MSTRIVESPKTKEIFTFKDEWNTPDGLVNQLQYEMRPGGKVHKHLHPNTTQWFEVVSGELTVFADGKTLTLKPGQKIETTNGGIHAQKNKGQDVTVVLEGYNPPINIEPFFTLLPKVFESKNPLKICVFFDDHRDVVSSKSISFKYIVPFLAKIGRIIGYEKWYDL